LLFAYLKYAEELAAAYGTEREGEKGRQGDKETRGQGEGDAGPAAVQVRPSKQPSPFAAALAEKLHAAQGIGADVHWGNEGFCVDVALRPGAGQDVTAGVLCDASRFAASEDPMEWDAFRTGVLERQGWKLLRVWTPHFFRDPKGAIRAIANAASPGPQKTRQKV
jgi:hypothetical protein